MMRRDAFRLLAVAGVLAASALLGAGQVAAHSQLVSTMPADGAVLNEPPQSVVLTFDEALIPEVDSISINDAAGNAVASATVEPVGSTLTVPWPAGLPDGVYQVAYRVVSSDGHPVIGAISFTVGMASAAPSESDPGAETAAGDDGGGLLLPVVVVAVIIILLGAAVAMARRRRG
jgi:methionine-rich copper-binding protein CopC